MKGVYAMKGKKRYAGSKIIAALLACGMITTCFSVKSEAEIKQSPEQQFRQLYLKLLENGESSRQDISDLNLSYTTCYAIAQEVKENEGFTAYQSYAGYNLLEPDEISYDGGQQLLLKFHMSQSDEEFLQRYTKVKKIIAEVQNQFDDKMTNLDKVLLIHEYVVEHIYYNNTNEASDHLGGPALVRGYGVCEGYTQAMMIFLRAENIPCKTVNAGAHEWLAVQIDGEWYHVDPTWDDTCSSSLGTHYFLMRNDNEFVNTLTKKHAKWPSADAISTSTKYNDWYIHDIHSKMYYYNGYWYYIFDQSVRKNNIQGTEESIVYEGKNLKILGIENGVLSISSDQGEKEFRLIKENISADTPTRMATPTVEIKVPTATITPVKAEKIKLGKTAIKSVSNKKGKKIKIVLKKKVINASGYEIKYSTNKKFKKSVKTVRFTGNSKTIGQLKKNKTYYVKVRAYKKYADGSRTYGPYSSVKKVKIKK